MAQYYRAYVCVRNTCCSCNMSWSVPHPTFWSTKSRITRVRNPLLLYHMWSLRMIPFFISLGTCSHRLPIFRDCCEDTKIAPHLIFEGACVGRETGANLWRHLTSYFVVFGAVWLASGWTRNTHTFAVCSNERKLEHSTQLMTMPYGPKKYNPSSFVALQRVV